MEDKIATAKQEILDFLVSKEAGIRSQFTRNTLMNAAEDLFISKGQNCPVAAIEKDGATYLINREIIATGAGGNAA